MDIITPGLGLVFWTAFFFLIVFFILGKKVFPAIGEALKTREDSIDEALKNAEEARKEVAGLKTQIEDMKKEARAEREEILADAKANANKTLFEAQESAKEEAKRIVDKAYESIEAEKRAALNEVKDVVAQVSLEIAEKLIRQKLEANDAQEQLVKEMLEEMNL